MTPAEHRRLRLQILDLLNALDRLAHPVPPTADQHFDRECPTCGQPCDCDAKKCFG